MKTLVLLMALMLSGCATTQLESKLVFPDVPTDLMVPPEPMKKLPDGPVKATDALAIVNDNYAAANANKTILEGLQAWIKETQANVKAANGKNNKDASIH